MTVEIVCCSVEDCIAAERAGADRIELCSALELGGLTPSIGLVNEALDHTAIEIMVMIRPRAGGFDYTESEFDTMMRDLYDFADLTIAGVVAGFLTSDGEIDDKKLGRFMKKAGELEVMHHRAIDVVPDTDYAMKMLIDHGVTRVLTSGRKNTALEGVENLRTYQERYGDKIEINPAGHIRPDNVKRIVEATGIPRVHLAPFELVDETSCKANSEISFAGVSGAPDGKRFRTEEAAVREVKKLLS